MHTSLIEKRKQLSTSQGRNKTNNNIFNSTTGTGFSMNSTQTSLFSQYNRKQHEFKLDKVFTKPKKQKQKNFSMEIIKSQDIFKESDYDHKKVYAEMENINQKFLSDTYTNLIKRLNFWDKDNTNKKIVIESNANKNVVGSQRRSVKNINMLKKEVESLNWMSKVKENLNKLNFKNSNKQLEDFSQKTEKGKKYGQI
jgi:hypothetical protein